MQAQMGIAGLFALGLALLILYVVLKKYTYPAVEEPFFSDPKLFMLFTVGLVEGTLLFVLFTYILPWYSEPGMGMLVAMLFGAILEFAKLVTMNLKRFNGKSDSIFYGFGLGLGMGAAMGFGLIYYLTSRAENLDVGSWICVLVMAAQYIFLNCGTGMIVGEGVARYRPFEFVLKALIINMIFQILMNPFYSIKDASLVWVQYVTLAVATVVIAYVFYRTVYRNLPRIVDDVLKMEGKKRDDIPGMR